jgi:predicted nucleic acid-binding protein
VIVVSDTSALSNLALVNHLWLLEAIYQTVIIPEVVANELAAASNPTISSMLQLGWIQTVSSQLYQRVLGLAQEP